MKELIKNIEDWAEKKEFIKHEHEYEETQYLKYLEKVGETARAILNKDEVAIVNGFGDIAINIIILAKQLNDKLSYDFKITQKNLLFEDFMEEIHSYYVDSMALFYLNNVSASHGYPLEICLKSAWNKTKNHK